MIFGILLFCAIGLMAIGGLTLFILGKISERKANKSK